MPYATVIVDGGLDLITPPQAVQAGRMIACSNYEVARQKGARRMDGYEKYDGGQSPSTGTGILAAITLQTSAPINATVGDRVHLTNWGAFGDQHGTLLFIDESTAINAPYPVVYISLLQPLPYVLSDAVGQVGFAFWDDENGQTYNILAASSGAPAAVVGPPSNLQVGAVNSTSAYPSVILPGTTLYYRVYANNANGATTPSDEVSVTTSTTAATQVLTSPQLLSNGLYFVQSTFFIQPPAVGAVVYMSDGTNTLMGQITTSGMVLGEATFDVSPITTSGDPESVAVGSDIVVTQTIEFLWDQSVVPTDVSPVTTYGLAGRAQGQELLIENVNIGDGNTIPYYRDIGTITPTLPLPTSNTTGSVASWLDNLAGNFTTISALVQEVPGQGNVNGLFWLKDTLYATRDYLAVSFTSGTTEPAIGDMLYQGASLGASTFSGQVVKIVLTSGSWNPTSGGNAAGVIMFYNVLGTISAAALNNDTQSVSAIATASTSTATSTAAGLYRADGERGNTIADQSWQWCDLGWNVQYNNGAVEFVDMNVALTLVNSATGAAADYGVTDWKQGTAGSTSGGSWALSGGTWPGVVSAEGDSEYVYHNFTSGATNFPKSGIFTVTGFGFTDVDIPSTASIAGIEIQFRAGAIGTNGQYTAAPIDLTFELVGLSSGQRFSLASSTVYPVTASAPNVQPIPASYNLYNFATTDIGVPTSVPGVPTSLLGYTSLVPSDVVSADFGLAYQVGLSGAQTGQKIQFGVDFIQMRVAYLPQTNQIYFWDDQSLRSVTDAAMTAGSKTLTSASSSFTSANIGETVIVSGAGLVDELLDGVMTASSTGLTSVSAPFTSDMVGDTITVLGAGAQDMTFNGTGSVTNGSITAGQAVLSSASAPFTAAMIGYAVTITGAGPAAATLTSRIVAFISTTQVRIANNANTTVTGTSTVKIYGLLTTTIATYVSATSVTLTAPSTVAVGAAAVSIYGNLTASITAVTNSTTVTLSKAADYTVSGKTATFYRPVLGQVVMHYKQGGDIATDNAYGALYFQFVQANGTVGGLPPRVVGQGESIRTLPTGGRAPDGGANDGSTFIANTATATNMNVMDWSALLIGAPQPDGSIAPASKYQSVTKNFYASSGLDAIYGVSGGGPAFYYDGIKTNAAGATVPGNFSRILTGLPLQFETPRGIFAHQGHIGLTYYSGVVQWSNAVNTLSFDPTLFDQTAGSSGFGERVTGAKSINGDTLAVWTQSTIQMMQGNFNIPSGNQVTPSLYTSTLAPTSGGIEYTIQPMANYMYCDFRGITAIGATQKYGDFELGHYSSVIAPWIIPRVQLSSFFEGPNIGIINSVLIRNKNMWRGFFADGAALSMTFLEDNAPPQFTIQNYTTSTGTALTWDVVQAFTESLGRDRIFGATADGNGFVYELERANSFNGAPITATVTLVPDVMQTPYANKEFSGITVFGQAQDYASFTLSRAVEYNSPQQQIGDNAINEAFGSSSASPTGTVAPFLSYGTAPLSIEGTAISLRFDSSSSEQFPHIIQAVSYEIAPLQEKTE